MNNGLIILASVCTAFGIALSFFARGMGIIIGAVTFLIAWGLLYGKERILNFLTLVFYDNWQITLLATVAIVLVATTVIQRKFGTRFCSKWSRGMKED